MSATRGALNDTVIHEKRITEERGPDSGTWAEEVAGTVDYYSNKSTALLVAALHDFARWNRGAQSAPSLMELLNELQDATPRRSVPKPSRRLASRIDNGQVQAIVEAYRGQAPMTEIATRFSISVSSVRRILEREGVGRRFGSIPEEVVERGRRMYEDGMAVQEVADQLRVSKSTLLRMLKKAGVQMRPTGRRPQH